VVEAKAWDKPLTEGVGQAKDYAGKLAVRFTYATNGQGVYGIDMQDRGRRRTGRLSDAGRTVEPDLRHGQPLARPLRQSALRGRGGYFQGRYYQDIAVERVLEAWPTAAAHPADAGHRHRQDLHRLPDRLEAVPQPLEPERLEQPGERRPRILFLADRNILANQAYNAFSAFPTTRWCASRPRTSARRARCRRTAACSSPSSRPS
jgi:type I restriction enzyme R subunit